MGNSAPLRSTAVRGSPVMSPVTPPDCRRCGACCFSQSPSYVRVTGDDWSRLGAEAGQRAHFIGHRAFMRMRDGHCAALEISRNDAAGGGLDFFCRVYERRPQTCRDLSRGSPQCEADIAMKGERLLERTASTTIVS
jgi:uncharacterized protein